MWKLLRLCVELIVGTKGAEPFLHCTTLREAAMTFGQMPEATQIGSFVMILLGITAVVEVAVMLTLATSKVLIFLKNKTSSK
jgi:hypothetical protein